MTERASEQYVIEAIGCLLRASPRDADFDNAALNRFREHVSARCDGPVSFDAIRNTALDSLRHLSAPASGDRARKFTILTRCDVRGEAHKKVAAELSLSRSQFYRDLRSARLALARIVAGSLERETPAIVVDALELNLATIRALHACGRTAEAIAVASEMALRQSGADSIATRCLMVELLADDYQIDAAERERANIPKISARSGAKFAWGAVMLLVADATLAVARFDRDAVQRARHALIAAGKLDDRQRRHDLEAQATSVLARALMESGVLAEGHALLESFDRASSRRPIRPSLRAALITVRSGLYQSEPWALAESYEQAHRLLQCAIVNELPRPGIDALTDFASLLCKQDKLATAEPFARVALLNARSVGSEEQVAVALGTMSLLYSESGRGADGLHAADELLQKVRGIGVWALQGAVLRSLALLRLERIDDALESSRRLVMEATLRGDKSVLGVAKRILAEAYASRGARPRALSEIDDSISLLESVGRPYTLSRSYSVSHRLSGNARHGSLARSLREALSGFDARPLLPGGVVIS